MSLLSNISDINFTTRYDVDKVVYKTSGSRSVAQASFMSDSTLITVPHDLGFKPLCIGQFSETPDFATVYDFNYPPYQFSGAFGLWLPRFDVAVESDATNVYIRMINFDTTRTLYYRVIGIVPSGVTSSPILDPALRDNELFNAKDNFLKILEDKKVTVSTSGGTATLIVPHALGYRPMALVFSESFDVVRRSGSENSFGVTGVSTVSYTDSANLYVEIDTLFSNVDIHYRIYLDN